MTDAPMEPQARGQLPDCTSNRRPCVGLQNTILGENRKQQNMPNFIPIKYEDTQNEACVLQEHTPVRLN